MRRSLAALLAALVLSVLSGCGSNDDGEAGDSTAAPSSTSTADDVIESPSPTEPAEPEFEELTEKQLRNTLLPIDDMPPGYSADPIDDSPSAATYCGSKPDRAPIRASQDFTKGGGFTGQLATVGLSQYPSEEVASTNLERLRNGLQTCKGETIDGDKVTYAVISTPKLDYPTLGIRTEGDGFAVMIYVAQVDSTMVTSGTGGLAAALDADLAGDLLLKQVAAYEDAAMP